MGSVGGAGRLMCARTMLCCTTVSQEESATKAKKARMAEGSRFISGK
jgi:hypothetical protein